MIERVLTVLSVICIVPLIVAAGWQLMGLVRRVKAQGEVVARLAEELRSNDVSLERMRALLTEIENLGVADAENPRSSIPPDSTASAPKWDFERELSVERELRRFWMAMQLEEQSGEEIVADQEGDLGVFSRSLRYSVMKLDKESREAVQSGLSQASLRGRKRYLEKLLRQTLSVNTLKQVA